jgi:nuclease S1
MSATFFGLRRAVSRVFIGVLLAALSPSLWAWGGQGHQAVAELAWQRLTPQARAGVSKLLALEPGQTLGSIASWADTIRDPLTAPWHYINFPRGDCHYQAERDCPDGNCVVRAIEQQEAILKASGADEERLRALKFVVHFVGDIHQPLHAGYRDDRGGNMVQLRFLLRNSNLHALWDSGLVGQQAPDVPALTKMMEALAPPSEQPVPAASVIAEESCRIVGTPGFYPPGEVDAQYAKQFTPIAMDRLALAGARLAAILNRSFP